MVDFVKQMASWHCDIKPYVELKAVTEDEYQEITGIEYSA